MRTRLSFLAICSLLLSLLTTTTPANSSTSNLEIFAVIDSKPGEVELTFISKIASKSITSYQITAKPKSGTGLTFTKSYAKKASGYITQKISPLTPEVDYIFTLTATTNKKKVIKSAPFTHLVSSNVPSTPLITKVEATDADEAVVFFTAPKDDGGSPIYFYTLTSNPAAVVITYPGQRSGSITIGGLTKATTYTFTLTAHNINGSSKAAISPAPITTLAEKIVRVSPTSSSSNAPTLAAPAFTLSSSSQSVIVNYAITTVTNTSTGGAIASYAISPAAPSGLSFSTSTGQLSGTPTSIQSATNYTITATNATGSATQTFTLTVTVGTPAFSLSSASETRTVNTAATGFTINSTGGAIASFAISATPAGMSFNTSTGALTGTPTSVAAATAYTITATNAAGSATATFTLTVTTATPAFSLSSASETRVATTAITGYTITSTGAPITSYSLVGTLPAGLSFDTSTGLTTGTPTETRTATTYTIIGASASGETATATYRLRVTGDIGDTGPGGGTIFYKRSTPFTCGPTRASTCTYLEAAPAGWNGGSDPQNRWAQQTPIRYDQVAVGSSGGDTATSFAIGWGYRNTRAIVAQGNTNTSTSVSPIADSHTVTVLGVVYDDWYLPSRDELNQMCKWARNQAWVSDATACNNSGTLNTGPGASGFTAGYYWSSSEYVATMAYPQDFTTGSQAASYKYNYSYIRPIRSF